ncbi:MAG: Hpt domain-containing protein [Clostridiales bacterium]|nr:Hpt domain-containing protein [Clostridiales bacterium]
MSIDQTQEEKKLLDIPSALLRVRGKEHTLIRMLHLFLNSREFDQLEEALAAQDYPLAANLAHAIKGMTGNLSMPLLFEASAEAVVQLRQNRLSDQVLARYRYAYARTRALVELLLRDAGE